MWHWKTKQTLWETVRTAKMHGWQTFHERSLKHLNGLPNHLNRWINYLNGLVSLSNRWVKISNRRANCSNGWINYLNGLINRSNGLLSCSNGWVKWINRLLILTTGWMIGLPIIQMNKLLSCFSKPFRVYGLFKEWAMLLCIVFISFVIVFNFKALILTIEIKDYFNSSLK